jgi:MFS family permease
MRFLLGAAEAGLIPGVLLYLTYWFPASRRGRITALSFTAIPMASILGGPVSGWILSVASGAYGLSGWEWLFLIEAIPSIVFGVAILFYLDDNLKNAKWLDADEKPNGSTPTRSREWLRSWRENRRKKKDCRSCVMPS